MAVVELTEIQLIKWNMTIKAAEVDNIWLVLNGMVTMMTCTHDNVFVNCMSFRLP